jgi:hypothetical protein
MNDQPAFDRLVTDWLRADAPPRAPQGVLSTALDRVAGVGQEPLLGGRRFDAWIGRSPRLHWAIVLVVLAAALLGAVAGAGAVLLEAPVPRAVIVNGWIAYSTGGPSAGSTDTLAGSDIYLVREGAEPALIAGREGGTARNVCPAFSPDGRRLAFGVASTQGRAVVMLDVNANGVTGDPVRLTVPGAGPGVCVRWSSDGTHIAYVDGKTVVVRGLDGSTPAAVPGDPTFEDFEPGASTPIRSFAQWGSDRSDRDACRVPGRPAA